MRDATPARQILNQCVSVSNVTKDSLGHTIGLALINATAVADGDACSILSTMLQVEERLVEIDGGRGSFRVAQLQKSRVSKGLGWSKGERMGAYVPEEPRTSTPATPHMMPRGMPPDDSQTIGIANRSGRKAARLGVQGDGERWQRGEKFFAKAFLPV